MKKWFIVLAIFVGLVTALSTIVGKYNELNRKYEVAAANIKAYDMQLSDSNEKNIALQLTVDQLNSFQDSIVRELKDTKDKLKIKDKRLKSLQYVKSEFTRTDTIIMNDTIFKEPSFKLEPLLGVEWYNVRIGFEHPSKVAVTPHFKSEKHIVVSTKKETVNPSKKFWLFRLFQKKHLVLKVDVIEKNPYVEGETSKYIEVNK